MDDIDLKPSQKVLKNGAVYDMELKRIVSNPGGGLAAFDSDSGRAAQAQKQKIRQAVIKQAANNAVKDGTYVVRFGDLAFLAEIAAAAYAKATNPADPKQIEAVRWLQAASGEGDESESAGDSAVSELRGLVRDIAELARAVSAARSNSE